MVELCTTTPSAIGASMFPVTRVGRVEAGVVGHVEYAGSASHPKMSVPLFPTLMFPPTVMPEVPGAAISGEDRDQGTPLVGP